MITEREANEEMERLVYYSKPRRTQLFDYNNRPYSQSNPFSVQAGPGKIVRGDLKRLPSPRSYAAGESVANILDNAVGVVFPNVSRFPSGGSGVILGGKLTKNTTSILNVSFRICTKSQNGCNVKIRSDNTSGHKGVGWHEGRQQWRARISFENKVTHLGWFTTKEEAAKARKAAIKLHGEFIHEQERKSK